MRGVYVYSPPSMLPTIVGFCPPLGVAVPSLGMSRCDTSPHARISPRPVSSTRRVVTDVFGSFDGRTEGAAVTRPISTRCEKVLRTARRAEGGSATRDRTQRKGQRRARTEGTMRDQPDSSPLSCLSERDDGRLPELLPSEPHGLHCLGVLGELVAVLLEVRQREARERTHVLIKRAVAKEVNSCILRKVWLTGVEDRPVLAVACRP